MQITWRVLVAAVVLCGAAGAQTATGILQGRVVDATASAVPEAKVTIENETTGVALSLVTNGEGNFFRSFLLPGNYRVTVEKQGFQQNVTNSVRVDVQQTVSLDIALKVGDVANTVEVQASSVQLATATSSVSTVIGSKMIMDLPLNGRNPFSLAVLTPGVIPTSGTSLPWISGGRNASSEITIDGTSVILPENNVSVNTLAYTPDRGQRGRVLGHHERAGRGIRAHRRRRDQRRHAQRHQPPCMDRDTITCATASSIRTPGATIATA